MPNIEAHQQDWSDLALFPAGHVEGYPDTFRALFSEIYAHIATGGPVHFPTFDDGLRSLLVCDAVARSARSGSWARVES